MSEFFINRPIVAMVIAILTVIVGIVSALTLPVAQFPAIVPPEIQVTAIYPGADAQTLEQSVSTPLEEQITGVDNMSYMQSVNASSGTTSITVDFDVKTDPNIDQVLTQLRTSQAQPQLPAQVNTVGLLVQKSLSAPLLLVALNSPNDTYDNTFLANYANINLIDELTRVPGIARVQIFGAGPYAMRVWVKPDQLAKLGVTVPQIVAALQTQNNVNPAGQVGGEPSPPGQQFTYSMRAQGRLTTPEEFGEIILRANPDGSNLRLKDVARLEMGAQSYGLTGRYNGKPAAVLACYQLPGSNAVDAAKALRAKVEELSKRFPQDITYTISLDTTAAVTAGMKEIFISLLEALALVVLVVYVFLQGWRATLIPLLAVPVSLIGTFVVFPMLGFSINTLSLFGLVLAIGLVVDDAIVVVEAVERHIEEGMTPRDAALQAMREVSGPVIAIALILTAVFIPTIFIPGITGRLYQQFAVTIAISVIFSAFNALSLSPALSALLLRPKKPSRGPLQWAFKWFNRGFGRITDGYVGLSAILIRKAVLSLLLLAIIGAVGVYMGSKLPSSFLPEEDYGYVFVNLQLPDAASLQRTSEVARQVEKIVMSTPGVQGCTSVIGLSLLSRVQDTYSAFFFVTEKPWDQRKGPEEQYQAIRTHITKELSKVEDGIAFSFAPPAIPGVGTTGGVTFMLEDRSGGTLEFLGDQVTKFLAAARKRPELTGISSTFLAGVPQNFVDVDRAKVMRQGVNIGDVYQTLQAFMGGYLVNYFNRFGRQWQVYVEAEGQYRSRADDVGQFYVANNKGQMLPLSAVTEVKNITGPEFTMRYNEYHAAQINASAAPGYSSGQATKALEEAFAQSMPREMGFDYSGMSFQEQQASKGVPPAAIFGLSLLFVFLILAAQYESWSLPFSVLLVTPVAVFGAYFTLWARHFENNVYAQIGLVMLIGLSAKNAILIVEFAKAEYERGKSIEEAALTGARIRLRPILMTAFAFILGCVPLWVATGSGAVSRQGLGTVVIGGMLAASIIAIFLIPVTFDVVEKISHRVSRGEKGMTLPKPLADPRGSVPSRDRQGVGQLVTVPLLLLLAGCTVGPNYHRPTVDVPADFRNQTTDSSTQSLGDQKWAAIFQDEELQKLIRAALEKNFDVRIAAARILQAQAQVGITRADQFPQISGSAGYASEKITGFGFNVIQLQGLFSWNVDFWGQYRRATEAARANLLASEWARRQVIDTIILSVATAYFQLRELDGELEVAQRTLASRKESLGLTQTLERGGAVGLLDVRQAEQLVETAAETIPETQRQIGIQEDLLSTLSGENPHDIPRGRPLIDQPSPPVVPAGLPSHLLERRPDIIQAEQQLVAANAQIGVARAQFFPSLPLTGSAGVESGPFSKLFTPGAFAWTFTAPLTQPIFTAGKLKGNLKLAQAQQQQAVFTYQQTIQTAFRQVSDSLISHTKYREFREHQELLTTAAQGAAGLSDMRYRGGAASYLEVLTNETNYFAAELNLARARLNERLSFVQLYNALGGGWE